MDDDPGKELGLWRHLTDDDVVAIASLLDGIDYVCLGLACMYSWRAKTGAAGLTST
jgi:hypothetical protein